MYKDYYLEYNVAIGYNIVHANARKITNKFFSDKLITLV